MHKDNGFEIIIITNQVGSSKGYSSSEDYSILTDWMISDLSKNGIEILDIFHYPHHSEAIVSSLSYDYSCRKPRLGMFLSALERHNISIESSFMVGDKKSVLTAAECVNIDTFYLVRSGHRIDFEHSYTVYDDLYFLTLDLFN